MDRLTGSCFSFDMEKSEVDFVLLVELLLEDFDGSAVAAVQIRRAALSAARNIPANHPLRDRLDLFAEDLHLAEFAIDGGAAAKWQAELLRVWRGIAVEIRRAGQTVH